jgi:predicted GIY-YIG superfamily endonuclease
MRLDLDRRPSEHGAGKGAQWTQRRRPVKIYDRINRIHRTKLPEKSCKPCRKKNQGEQQPGRRKKVATIQVLTTDHGDTYEFEVTVKEGLGKTRHRVTLRKADYERLSGGKANPETLVSESFHFLLEREPKESILRSFDLTLISRYFPEYEREITRRL